MKFKHFLLKCSFSAHVMADALRIAVLYKFGGKGVKFCSFLNDGEINFILIDFFWQ